MSNGEFEALAARISALAAQKGHICIGIDGRCGAGKTTLAARLAERFHGASVHTDDFFLPPEMRTPERLAEPGGNLDRERFLAEVVPFIGGGKAFSYGVFDCRKGRITGRRQVCAARLTIVEGGYSLHPAFGDIYDLRVFCDISKQLQLERLAAREGDAAPFAERWIPLEERYFAAFGIKESCGALITAM